MTREELFEQMKLKHSMLCVGLDSDFDKMPSVVKSLAKDAPVALQGSFFGGKARSVIDFNKAIIDATAPHCIAFKPNLAFYECYGNSGMKALELTVDYIRTNYPRQFIIADAKRGDIGNTAQMYARTFFETMDFDAVTLSPYMGSETVIPFLQFPGKYAIVVALSSNKSSADFQLISDGGKPFYQIVMEKMMALGTPDNLMFVVGATQASKLSEIRRFCPDNFFLVPGVGAQGGSAEDVIKYGANSLGGLIINSSRGVIYASQGDDFAAAAASAASQTAKF